MLIKINLLWLYLDLLVFTMLFMAICLIAQDYYLQIEFWHLQLKKEIFLL